MAWVDCAGSVAIWEALFIFKQNELKLENALYLANRCFESLPFQVGLIH
jgi:hypothetical protein